MRPRHNESSSSSLVSEQERRYRPEERRCTARNDVPQSPIQSASGPMGSEEERRRRRRRRKEEEEEEEEVP